jgi:hypothetical protein
MTLAEIQTGLCDIIKSRPQNKAVEDDYFAGIAASDNLRLVQKISHWWRMVQIQEFSVLTGNYLRLTNALGGHIYDFLRTEQYSAFRNEVGFQFLNYLVKVDADEMTTNLAELEINLIGQRLGKEVHYSKIWKVDPYRVINSLIQHTYNPSVKLKEGRYEVIVSSDLKSEVFRVNVL